MVSGNYRTISNLYLEWIRKNKFSHLVVGDNASYLIDGKWGTWFKQTGPGVGKLRKAEAFLHYVCNRRRKDGGLLNPSYLGKVQA